MGTRKDEKGKRFEFLISRIDEAIEEGYYVEALSITYALFEERTYQLLDRLNIPYRNDDKLYNCLNKLENAIKNRSIMVTSQRLSADSLIDLLNEYFITSQLITD